MLGRSTTNRPIRHQARRHSYADHRRNAGVRLLAHISSFDRRACDIDSNGNPNCSSDADLRAFAYVNACNNA